MNRFNYAKNTLEKTNFFKLVCGAGNETASEIYNLALLYTLAGATALDVAAKPDIIAHARKGIDDAILIAPKLRRTISNRPFIMISVGLKGDPHLRKAIIKDHICSKCGLCITICDQKAISEEVEIITTRCIGCGKCFELCPVDAIDFEYSEKEIEKIIPDCLREGAEMIELHAASPITVDYENYWRYITRTNPDNYNCISLDRKNLSDRDLLNRIEMALRISPEKTIIQADGSPMRGGKDDFNSTLQAVAISDIISKSRKNVFILASGGTNSKTKDLAKQCNVAINGVAIGSYARKIVKNYLEVEDLLTKPDLIEEGVIIAERLVESCKGD